MNAHPDAESLDEDLATADERRYDSLADALRDWKTPLENHALITRFTDAIGIDAVYARSGYIKAVRRSGGPDLRIAPGWTNGFLDEAEVVQAAGDIDRWASEGRPGVWGITHPVHGHANPGNRGGTPKREGNTCPQCGDVMPLTGVCDYCG